MPRKVDKEARRRRIIEAAVEGFVDEGYQYMAVDEIAERAEVSKGTVYFYFEDKADILHAAFRWFEEGLHKIMDETEQLDRPPEYQLAYGVHRMIDFATSNRAIVQILIDSWSASLHDPKQTKIDFPAFYERLVAPLEKLITYGRFKGAFRADLPDHYPRILTGSLQGLLIEWMADPDSLPLASLHDEVDQLLIDPILNESD